MILQQTDNYIKACMKTWLLCESCILAEENSYYPREELISKCRACAHSCFAVVCRIISNNEVLQESAFICVLNCRECYDECEKYHYIDDIDYCGQVCLFCAGTLKELLLPENLN